MAAVGVNSQTNTFLVSPPQVHKYPRRTKVVWVNSQKDSKWFRFNQQLPPTLTTTLTGSQNGLTIGLFT